MPGLFWNNYLKELIKDIYYLMVIWKLLGSTRFNDCLAPGTNLAILLSSSSILILAWIISCVLWYELLWINLMWSFWIAMLDNFFYFSSNITVCVTNYFLWIYIYFLFHKYFHKWRHLKIQILYYTVEILTLAYIYYK